jgi:hypothetical protein
MINSGQNLCGRPKKNVCTVNVKLWYIIPCPVTNWEEGADAIAARPESFKQGPGSKREKMGSRAVNISNS